jgi:hypothetical protein
MSRLGRNPFQKNDATGNSDCKKKASQIFIEEELAERPEGVRKKKASVPPKVAETLAHFFLVDLRAESFVLGLKAALLVRSAWD